MKMNVVVESKDMDQVIYNYTAQKGRLQPNGRAGTTTNQLTN